MFDTAFLVDLTESTSLTASDVAARMLAGGGMNPFTNEKKTVADFESGYVGWLDGMPLYAVTEQIKDAIYYYLGLDATANASVIAQLDQLVSLICPSNATLRGLRPTSFKTVDDPDTQGVIIQPKVNMGVRCLSGNSLKAVFSGSDFDTVAKAKTAITAIRSALKGKFVLPNLSYDYDIPKLLESPILIFQKNKDDIIAVVNAVDKNKKPIIVPIKINGKGRQNFIEIDANIIKSVYGKDNFSNFLKKNVTADNILLVENKKIRNLKS